MSKLSRRDKESSYTLIGEVVLGVVIAKIVGMKENAIMRRLGLKTLLFPLFIVAAIVVCLALGFWI
jgi:urea transporter